MFFYGRLIVIVVIGNYSIGDETRGRRPGVVFSQMQVLRMSVLAVAHVSSTTEFDRESRSLENVSKISVLEVLFTGF